MNNINNNITNTPGDKTYDTTLTIAQMPSHTHNVNVFTRWGSSGWRWADGRYASLETITSTSTGDGQGHNHDIPHIGVWIWKRIS